MSETKNIAREFSFRTMDGLTIRGYDYGDHLSPNVPLVCLPGLTRSTRDFEDIADHLSQDENAPRRVLTLDYRGRGRSDYAVSYTHLTLPTICSV